MKIKEVIVEAPVGAALSGAAKAAVAGLANAGKAVGSAIGSVARAGANMASDSANVVTGAYDTFVDRKAVEFMTNKIMKKWNKYLSQVRQANKDHQIILKNDVNEAVTYLDRTKTPKYPTNIGEFQELLTAWLVAYTGKPIDAITGGKPLPKTTSTEASRGFFHNIAQHLVAQQRQKKSEEGFDGKYTQRVANDMQAAWTDYLKNLSPQPQTADEIAEALKNFVKEQFNAGKKGTA